jgi:hypothetical protein
MRGNISLSQFAACILAFVLAVVLVGLVIYFKSGLLINLIVLGIAAILLVIVVVFFVKNL